MKMRKVISTVLAGALREHMRRAMWIWMAL